METNEQDVFEIFPWNKNFETGIALIDEQHKVLVNILNKLAINFSNRSSEIIMNEIFDELVKYTDYHFKTEEEIWSKYLKGDPWFETHKKTHKNFIHETLALKNHQADKSLDDIIYEVISFLAKWLAYHILDTDKHMAYVIMSIEKGISIEEAKIYATQKMSGSSQLLIDAVLSMYDYISTRTIDLMREKALRLQAEEALSRSEERWKFILEAGVNNVWDWDMVQNNLSHSKDDIPLISIINQNLNTSEEVTVYPADIETLKNNFEAHVRGESEFYACKYRILRKNGSWSWFVSRGKIVARDNEGNPLRMIGTHTDITERELASKIYLNSDHGMMISDMNNRIISVNDAFTKITGYSEDDVIGKDPKILASGKHDKDFFRLLWKEIHQKGQWQGEIYNKRQNAEIYPQYMMINTIKDEGKIDHYFSIFNDITTQKKSDELILRHANYDPLTNLPNRRMLFEKLKSEIVRSDHLGTSFALLFIDLDHFKNINDVLGHGIGDMLLVEAAKRITRYLRINDTLARIGGDEFTIIFPDFDSFAELEQFMQDIINDLSQPFMIDINKIHISASIGVAVFPTDTKDASELLQHADQAMYLAKESGRSCYRYFIKSMQEDAEKRRIVINDLHEALKREEDQFEVFYQPIIDFQTGKVIKAEALVRWNHPTNGLVYPDEFIGFAEESGLIINIGDIVYKKALLQLKDWQERYDADFQVSINISPVELNQSTKPDEWIELLSEIGLKSKSCVLEITENIFMCNIDSTKKKLVQLRQSGIKISLDDFGTGYSSLSYLQQFEIDYLKIDRSFTDGLTKGSSKLDLCEAMISMAHKLDIKVVAEGIETEEQKLLLKGIKCDFAQGYLCSKPISAIEFEQTFLLPLLS